MSNQLNEGLRHGDLKHFVSDTFMIDTYRSKMGEDRDVAVLSFRVRDRLPALDLMEFIERGYGYVLDADISSGEESDGQYSVFVEIERNKRLPERIKEIIEGIEKLTGIDGWRYRYHQEWKAKEFTIENVGEQVPTSPDLYDSFLHESKVGIVKEFFNQVMYQSMTLDENNILTLTRPFTDGLRYEIKEIGDYMTVMANNTEHVKLDETAVAETVFLNKIFGNYEIIKLGENFMLRKGKEALLIKPL
jgi:hypothetical protein